MKTQKFEIGGMSCAACSSRVEKTVAEMDGVKSCGVNLLTGSMEVVFDESIESSAGIIKAVEGAGYSASAGGAVDKGRKENSFDEVFEVKRRLVFSLVFAIPLMYISMMPMLGFPVPDFLSVTMPLVFSFVQFLLLLPVVFVNRSIFANGFKSFLKKSPNMNSLIAVGSGASVLYGTVSMFRIMLAFEASNNAEAMRFVHGLYFDSAAMILTLVALGKFFEAKAKRRTSSAISKLIELSPRQAKVIRNGEEVQIACDEILKGDVVVIKPGETIPVDGVIIQGHSELDTSAITGESLPSQKDVGSKVISGSINLTGSFRFRAEQVGSETTLAKIIKLVENASSTKAPIARIADKISMYFVPIVILIAVITFLVWFFVGAEFAFAFSSAIAVLVISCPCALGLATPTAIMVAMGKSASLGVLIKSAEALETLHGVKAVVFDKTGTITEGKLKVDKIKVFNCEYTDSDVLALAYSVEVFSEHPIAAAVVEFAKSNSANLVGVKDFTAVPGKGVEAVVSDEESSFFGKKIIAGNKKLMQENNVSLNSNFNSNDVFVNQLEIKEASIMIAVDGLLVGVIYTADKIKENSAFAIKHLKIKGIKTFMLTGDNYSAAKKISEQANIDEFHSELLPDEKQNKIAEIKKEYGVTAFVGDGINDSPSLATADVGIALAGGTDIAIESADIVLVNNDLTDVVNAIEMSKQTMRNIKQNLFWALFYNSLGIPLAAGVFYHLLQIQLNPIFAAAAMSMSSVTVTMNALRLRFFKPPLKIAKLNKKNINTSDKDTEVPKMNKTEFKVDGMACGHCSARVEKALSEIAGVKASVNLEAKTVTVEHPETVTLEMLKQTVKNAGYEPV